MTENHTLILNSECRQNPGEGPEFLEDNRLVAVDSVERLWQQLVENRDVEAVVIPAPYLKDPASFWRLVCRHGVLRHLPDAIVLVDERNTIIDANQRFPEWFPGDGFVGVNFYDAIGDPEVLGPSYSPLSTALKAQTPCNSTIRTASGEFYQLRAVPVGSGDPSHVFVTLRNISAEMLHLEKLEAIHRAGAELADLTPEEVFQMDVPDRIELLKANIIHYTQDLLKFDVVELRLIDQKTSRLEVLLSVGIDAEDSRQPLYACEKGNGVSGHVCATGQSYLCPDTSKDDLYVKGLVGAKSSLTVPLIYHNEVIGSLNVESPEVKAFSESDKQLLQIFAHDIAVALNTLELLVAQSTNTAQRSVLAIHGAVAAPIDEILNDTVNVIENYIGHDHDAASRLRSILKNARNIKKVIQDVGRHLVAEDMIPESIITEKRPFLQNLRILVIDADEEVRESAHMLLERYGCTVETAQCGAEAVYMIRNCDADHCYDAIIADIRLSDLDGYELLLKLKEILGDNPPLLLMTGFGYDPGHAIVKSRKAGLPANAVLYKPFKLEQLLTAIQTRIGADSPPTASDQQPNDP